MSEPDEYGRQWDELAGRYQILEPKVPAGIFDPVENARAALRQLEFYAGLTGARETIMLTGGSRRIVVLSGRTSFASEAERLGWLSEEALRRSWTANGLGRLRLIGYAMRSAFIAAWKEQTG